MAEVMRNLIGMVQKYPTAMKIFIILVSMLAGLLIQLGKGRTWNRQNGYFVQWKAGTLIPRVFIGLANGLIGGCICAGLLRHYAEMPKNPPVSIAMGIASLQAFWTKIKNQEQLTRAEEEIPLKNEDRFLRSSEQGGK